MAATESEERLWCQLDASNAIAFIPKEFRARWAPDPPQDPPRASCATMDYSKHAPLSRWAASRWKLVAEGSYFCLYSR